ASGVVGSESDLETRIDEDVRGLRADTFNRAALMQMIGQEPLTGLLHIESTHAGGTGRPGASGNPGNPGNPGNNDVFVNRRTVSVLSRSTTWSQDEALDVLRTTLDPVWTKAGTGIRWIETSVGSQQFQEVEGLERLAVTARGRLLFLSNDSALLGSVLDSL